MKSGETHRLDRSCKGRRPGIGQPVAIQILRTLARYVKTETGNVKVLLGVDPPLLRLRAQDHRVFFRDKGDYIEIDRVLDRKEAYR